MNEAKKPSYPPGRKMDGMGADGRYFCASGSPAAECA